MHFFFLFFLFQNLYYAVVNYIPPAAAWHYTIVEIYLNNNDHRATILSTYSGNNNKNIKHTKKRADNIFSATVNKYSTSEKKRNEHNNNIESLINNINSGKYII